MWWRPSLLCLVAAIILLGQPVFSSAQEKQVPEYHLKAVFLYNLVNFISWPEERREEERAFVITILGNDPFGPILDQTVSGERWHGRPIHIIRYANIADLENHRCDVLFVSSGVIDQLPEIRRILGHAPILTVADSKSFTTSGGMVNLVQERSRIVLEINLQATSSAGLFVSSKLLRLARLVN